MIPLRLAAALLPLALSLGAQGPAAAPAPFDAALAGRVAGAIADAVERTYVYPDTGRLIAARLRDAGRRGAYAAAGGHAQFAEALTRDLQAVNGDGHLYVSWRPAPASPAGGPEARPAGGPDGGGPRRVVRGPADGNVPSPAAVAQAWRTNFGIERVERLEGNVGLLEVRGFSPFPEVREKLEQAMRLLDGTDAMILDLRRAPGGSAFMANLLASTFTGPDTIHTLNIYDRRSGETRRRWTLPDVPWRRPDVPLYILTSTGTGSASEDVTFVLRNLGRATTVGDRTGGAGHNNALIDVGDGYTVSVSYSRVYDPKTGAEWEKTGVPADIPVAPERAQATAHAHALARLAQAAPPPLRRQLEETRAWIEAIARNAPTPAEALARYPGAFGERTIAAEEGRLWYRRRPDRPRFALVPIAEREYAGEGGLRVRFAADGASIEVTTPEGEWLTFARTR